MLIKGDIKNLKINIDNQDIDESDKTCCKYILKSLVDNNFDIHINNRCISAQFKGFSRVDNKPIFLVTNNEDVIYIKKCNKTITGLLLTISLPSQTYVSLILKNMILDFGYSPIVIEPLFQKFCKYTLFKLSN